MGQKVSPIGMRVGVIRDWQSRWYADDKEFGTLLMEDVKIRELVEVYYAKLSNEAVDKRKADPQISRIEIERTKGRMTAQSLCPGRPAGKPDEVHRPRRKGSGLCLGPAGTER